MILHTTRPRQSYKQDLAPRSPALRKSLCMTSGRLAYRFCMMHDSRLLRHVISPGALVGCPCVTRMTTSWHARCYWSGFLLMFLLRLGGLLPHCVLSLWARRSSRLRRRCHVLWPATEQALFAVFQGRLCDLCHVTTMVYRSLRVNFLLDKCVRSSWEAVNSVALCDMFFSLHPLTLWHCRRHILLCPTCCRHVDNVPVPTT